MPMPATEATVSFKRSFTDRNFCSRKEDIVW